MITIQQQIQNLQTILSGQKNLTSENRQVLLKEIERLKKELSVENGVK